MGSVLGAGLALGAPYGGLWVGMGLSWLSSRVLVLVVGASVLLGVLRKAAEVEAGSLAAARRSTLACAAGFYFGYGVGWLGLWGYLGF